MGTSVGLWCVEHTVGYWESGVRHDEAMAWVWRNRQLLLAAGALLDEPGPGWEVIGHDGSPLQHGLEQFIRTHRECPVRHYNEYGDIGDVVLDELPPCGALHPQLQGTTADGATVELERCTWQSVTQADVDSIEADPGDWHSEGSGAAWVKVLTGMPTYPEPSPDSATTTRTA